MAKPKHFIIDELIFLLSKLTGKPQFQIRQQCMPEIEAILKKLGIFI